MEKKNITLREPRLRVSRKFYIQIMENVLNEAVFLDHEEGMLLIYAVRAYLQTSRNAPGSGDRIYKLFRRYRDIIDRAAERSARARAAAQRRRQASLQSTPAPAPENHAPNPASNSTASDHRYPRGSNVMSPHSRVM